MHNGDKTLKLWKPMLTQFLLYEAYRNVLCMEIQHFAWSVSDLIET